MLIFDQKTEIVVKTIPTTGCSLQNLLLQSIFPFSVTKTKTFSSL